MQNLSDQAQQNKRAYIARYNAEQYERITIRVPKGKKAILKKLADDMGISLNELFMQGIEKVRQL